MGAFKIYNTTTSQWEYAKTLPANTTLVNGADVMGTVNGVNTTFTTPTAFVFINVYKNGVRMRAGASNDYTISGNNTIIFNTAPATGSIITVDYGTQQEQMINGSNSMLSDEVPTGTVNGSNTAFTTSRAYVPGSLQVWINGVKQARTTHFTETTPTSGIFTMGDAPLTGDHIMVSYQFIVSTSGNADTVDGFHASQTMTAGTIPVLDSNAMMPTEALGGAWQSWTPTFTNLTIGNGSYTARYRQIGKVVYLRLTITMGSTSSVGTNPSFTLPVAATSYGASVGEVLYGQAVYLDAGTNSYMGAIGLNSTTVSNFYRFGVSGGNITKGGLSSTTPFTWGNTDEMNVTGAYEAA